MKTFAALALAAFFASAAAPALAAGCADPSAAVNLSGSKWIGIVRWDDGETHAMKIKLRADCTVEYNYDNNTYTNGRWVQRGSLIEWDTNDSYAVYLGQAGQVSLGGEMYNKVGNHGIWSMLADD